VRILQLITRSELGGAQRYVAEIARRQRQHGFDVELATGALGWLSDQHESFAKVHRIPDLVRQIDPARDSAALVTLAKFLRDGRYDVVHTHCNKAGLLGRIAAAIARVPVVAYTSHGSSLAESLSPKHAMYWVSEQLGARLTDRLFAISETERAMLLRSVWMDAEILRVMTVVPEHIRTMPAEWELHENARWDLVAVGNLYPNKGFDVMLPAMAELAKRYPRLRLVIYGEGPQRPLLEADIARLGLRDRVVLWGQVTDVSNRILQAGIYVLPSRKEGLPLALLEAMATGVPIVATDVGAVREVIGPDVALARPVDPGALVRVLDDLLSSDERRLAQAHAGRAAFERLLPRDDPSLTPLMYA